MSIENDLYKAKAHIDMALIGAQEATPESESWASGYFAGKSEAQRTQLLLADQLVAAKKSYDEELQLNEDRRAMLVELRTKNEELRAQVIAREAARNATQAKYEEAMRNSVSRAAFDKQVGKTEQIRAEYENLTRLYNTRISSSKAQATELVELHAKNDLLRTEYAANNTKIYQLRRERDAAQAKYEECNGWFIASRTERDELRANPEARTLRQQVVIDELRAELARLRASNAARETALKDSQRTGVTQYNKINELRAKLDAIKRAAS